MNTKRSARSLWVLLALVTASACQESPTQPGATLPETVAQSSADAKTPATASVPDFTGSYRDLISGAVVNVSAYHVGGNTWRVRITVIQCFGDMCTGTILEDIYTMIPPTDPRFESVLRSALDIDGDGRWDGEKKPEIDYQR